MISVRPKIPQVDKTLARLNEQTGLNWMVCPNSHGTACAVSRCRRYTYWIEAVPLAGFMAGVDLRSFTDRTDLAACIAAINDHQFELGQRNKP